MDEDTAARKIQGAWKNFRVGRASPSNTDASLFDLLVCVAGIYTCFLTWGILQERLTTTPYDNAGTVVKFNFFVFLNTCQSLVSALWALAYVTFTGQGLGRRTPKILKTSAAVALSASVASPFGYESLAHINYPTHMLAKSCKLVSVMLVGVLLHRRAYSPRKYVSVALVTSGVSAFMLLLPHKGEEVANSLYGLILVLINMLLDGYTGSTQDELLTSKQVSAYQMMFWMNAFSFVGMLCYILNPWKPELFDAVRFLLEVPRAAWDVALFCVCGAIGQTFVFKSLGCFGSITLVTITVTRKLFTIILSVIFYGHQISVQQWVAIAVVFLGILSDSLPKDKPKQS